MGRKRGVLGTVGIIFPISHSLHYHYVYLGLFIVYFWVGGFSTFSD